MHAKADLRCAVIAVLADKVNSYFLAIFEGAGDHPPSRKAPARQADDTDVRGMTSVE